MKEKPRFIVKCNMDKEYKECEFKIEDSWASRYGAIVTFHLPYSYTQSQLNGELEKSKNALRKDYNDMNKPSNLFEKIIIYFIFGVAILGLVFIISNFIG